MDYNDSKEKQKGEDICYEHVPFESSKVIINAFLYSKVKIHPFVDIEDDSY